MRIRRRVLRKLKISRESLGSLTAAFLILAAGLTFVSFFAQAAEINNLWQEFLNSLFGWGAIFTPFWLGAVGLLLLRSVRVPFLRLNHFYGFSLFLLSFSGLAHLFFGSGEEGWRAATLGQGGGYLGFWLVSFLTRSFSRIGAFLILATGLAVSWVIAFNTPWENLLRPPLLGMFLAWRGISKWRERQVKAPAAKKSEPLPLAASSPTVSSEKNLNLEILPTPSEPVQEIHPEEAAPPSRIRPKEKEAKPSSSLPLSEEVWHYPPLSLLNETEGEEADRGDISRNADLIEKTLASFGIRAKVVEINRGPSVTQYALESAQGTKIVHIKSLQNDLALALASPTGSVRLEAPIPGKSLVGIEVPNLSPATVTLKNILASPVVKQAPSKLTVALGQDVAGAPVVSDLSKMPHVLVAGATGSGKSTMIHAFLASLIFRSSPAEVRLILVDTKRVELTEYNQLPHLLTPVINEPEKILSSLRWAISEMDRRYRLFQSARVRDLLSFNELSGFQALPYIVIVVDELADLMALAPVEVEKSICRLAQLSRATGIHLLLSTQRPDVRVLTGLIKANIPCRIAFATVSQIDSRVIIDQGGAEKLLGRGDMLYVPPDASKPRRIQGVYVSSAELRRLLDFIRQNNPPPAFAEEVLSPPAVRAEAVPAPDDQLFAEAVSTVCQYERASASLLQRRLKIGYARAARLLDTLQARGIVGAADGAHPREVLIHDPDQVLGSKDSSSKSEDLEV